MPKNTGPISLAAFQVEHIPLAVELSAAESWPHAVQDWATTLELSKGVVALSSNRVVATACATDFGPVTMLNMVIVAKAFRGKGLGLRVLQAVMKEAGAWEMRLFATEEGRPLYEKVGFRNVCRNFQHQGIVRAIKPVTDIRNGYDCLDDLIAMDTNACGMERAELLRRMAERHTILSGQDGFAVLREFGPGFVVGPVVAKNQQTAKSLITMAASQVSGRFLRLDTTEPSISEFVSEKLNLPVVGGGSEMALNIKPKVKGPYQRAALASQAFG